MRRKRGLLWTELFPLNAYAEALTPILPNAAVRGDWPLKQVTKVK